MVENKQQPTNTVLSDRRARRKAKRGETVPEVNATVSSDDSALTDTALTSTNTTAGKGVATRKQREAIRDRERAMQSTAENVPVVGGLAGYLRGVWSEIQKVTWPTQEEAQRLTAIVLIVTTIFAIFLGIIDVFYGWWFQEGLRSTTTFLLVGIPFMAIALFISWVYILREPS